METLRAAYEMAKQNDGAPGVDGVTFEAIEAQGAEALLEQLRDELTGRTYKPLPARRQEIPKDGGKVRVLSIPATYPRPAGRRRQGRLFSAPLGRSSTLRIWMMPSGVGWSLAASAGVWSGQPDGNVTPSRHHICPSLSSPDTTR